VDLKDIKAIIDLMKKNSVSEFELEKQDFKIRLKRGMNGGGVLISQAEEGQPMVYAPAPAALPAAVSGAVPAALRRPSRKLDLP